MPRVPISLKEKVEARYERKSRDQCWIWQGATYGGRPAMNMRHVMRFIFEEEFGSIPEGYSLWRTDHTEDCKKGRQCRHLLCVNPYHVQLRDLRMGTYERGGDWQIDDPEKVRGYKKRVRAKGRTSAVEGDTKGESLSRDVGGTARVRMATPAVD
jgi:hypothetical protein